MAEGRAVTGYPLDPLRDENTARGVRRAASRAIRDADRVIVESHHRSGGSIEVNVAKTEARRLIGDNPDLWGIAVEADGSAVLYRVARALY